tara:strand:- start:236 stop:496 length:261 start_codon:yes stop_codon:yes gene_type:complete
MDVLENLMTEIYENKHHYKEGDYIQLCRELKESYNTLKGITLTKYEDKGPHSDNDSDEDDEIIIHFTALGLEDYIPEYGGDYLDSY